MQNSTENHLAGMKKGNILRRNVGTIICALSVLVILGVFWSLKLTGITLAGEAFCGMEEHVHDETCETENWICTLEESEEHTHTEECYEIVYICGLEEHVHEEDCYTNLDADLETAEIWEASLPDLSGTAAEKEKLVQVARSQVGMGESTLNFTLDEAGVRHGITRYGQWYGNPYGDWSGMFACFCLHYAGITGEMVPYNAGAESMRLSWEASGLLIEKEEAASGDLLFLDRDQNGTADQVGIISEVKEESFGIILGDYEDKTAELEISRADGQVLSIGSIEKPFVSNSSEEDQLRVEEANRLIAALPTLEEIAAKQEELPGDSEEYQAWYQELERAVLAAYVYYEDLPESLRQQVVGAERLEALSWIWDAEPISNEAKSAFEVYQINTYSNAVTTLVYGGSVQNKLDTVMSFTYWDAVIVEKDEDGLYVSEVNTKDEPKSALEANTADGFVLLLFNQNVDAIKAGQIVWASEPNFYTGSATASSTSLGTITFTEPKDHQQELHEVSSDSTKDLITIDLYDYSSNINDVWRNDSEYPGFQAGNGTTSIASLTQWSMNFGDNIKADTGVQVTGDKGKGGAINATDATEGSNRPISGAMSKTLKDGYPALANGNSLAYLFTNGTYATKKNTANVDGLFHYDPKTGTYHFNSRENNAQFDAATNTFKLYKELLSTNFIMYPFGNFMPFNNITTETTQVTKIDRAWFQTVAASAMQKYHNGQGEQYKTLSEVLTQFVSAMDEEVNTTEWNYDTVMKQYFEKSGLALPPDDPAGSNEAYLSSIYSIDYDVATDFFFGMSMKADFMQPEDGLVGVTENQPMKYDFKGDDDVWVYIDGTLFLDLSGIHRHVGGSIDFQNGAVEYYALDTSTGEVKNEPYQSYTFAEILGSTEGLNEKGTFEDYSTHTMNFYYMERGAGSGVCEIEFNFPLLKRNGIMVTKKLEGIEGTSVLGNPDFYFQCYKEGGTELLIGEGVSYRILDESGNEIGTRKTDKNGIFYIKAGQSADFGDIFQENGGRYFVRELLNKDIFAQYGEVSVDGDSITIDETSNLVIDLESFQGIDSPLKDISDGNTTFLFRNHVDVNKFGSFELSKEVLGADEAAREKEFTFLVEFDGQKVPAGTAYTLKTAEGTSETKTVEEAGTVTLKHGQKAYFEHILAGTQVFVAESAESAGDYNVSYSGENITLTEENNGVSGTIGVETTSSVKVTNALDGAVISLPVKKLLKHSDGEEHTYTFLLQQIASLENPTLVEGGTTQRQTVTLKEGSTEFQFQLLYSKSTEPGTYYYQITEADAQDVPGMDASRYFAEILLEKVDEVLVPTLKGLYKGEVSAEQIEFVNSIVRELTIQKTVENISTEDTFRFEITASLGDTPLEGTFPCSGLEGITEVTFTGGKAEVSLKHGQSITIEGLPYGLSYQVEEKDAAGYLTQYAVGDTAPLQYGTAGEGTLKSDTTVRFVNSQGVELPATGTYTRQVCLLAGWGLILASLLCAIRIRRRKKKSK